jgi:hypothetical protein
MWNIHLDAVDSQTFDMILATNGLIIYILTNQHTSSTKVDALHSILSEKLSLENI